MLTYRLTESTKRTIRHNKHLRAELMQANDIAERTLFRWLYYDDSRLTSLDSLTIILKHTNKPKEYVYECERKED